MLTNFFLLGHYSTEEGEFSTWICAKVTMIMIVSNIVIYGSMKLKKNLINNDICHP